jgi:putative ABC transport system substrate-binding protein
VVGLLRAATAASLPQREVAFRNGLASVGFIEGRNVVIDYQFAENQTDHLPALATELIRRQVAVIYAGDNSAALAAKAATMTIPIVFRIGGDPVQLGLVAHLNRPGGNVTGVSFLASVTVAIRLQMLHEAVPTATVMGLLVNRGNPNSEPDTREAQQAAQNLGVELRVVGASSAKEIDAAFEALIERRVQALVINGDSFFADRRQQLAVLIGGMAKRASAASRVGV